MEKHFVQILEFNETTQDFHFNDGSNREYSHGYNTISKNVPYRKALYFAQYIEKRFTKCAKPIGMSFKQIVREWKHFDEVLRLGAKQKDVWL